jgi:hypothetical protein
MIHLLSHSLRLDCSLKVTFVLIQMTAFLKTLYASDFFKDPTKENHQRYWIMGIPITLCNYCYVYEVTYMTNIWGML